MAEWVVDVVRTDAKAGEETGMEVNMERHGVVVGKATAGATTKPVCADAAPQSRKSSRDATSLEFIAKVRICMNSFFFLSFSLLLFFF